MQTVAIVGVGLIGGSFGLALRKAGFLGDLVGVSSPPAIEAGLAAGAINRGAALKEAAACADLIYLSQPVDGILRTLSDLPGLTRPECLVTDAGSTKEAIVGRAAESLPGVHFLGGHPIAGKEQRGAQAADAHLFRDRLYVLTPHSPETANSLKFREWLAQIGARVVHMTPAEHDRTVAFTSHLPQVISTALALTLSREPQTETSEVFGTGLLDMTRLSMSSPDLWRPILETNRASVAEAIRRFRASLDNLEEALGRSELEECFEVAAIWAKLIRRRTE